MDTSMARLAALSVALAASLTGCGADEAQRAASTATTPAGIPKVARPSTGGKAALAPPPSRGC